MSDSAHELARLVEEVRSARKYRSVSPELVRAIGAIELEKRRSWKEAVKATKSRLHQIAGAYLAGSTDFAVWMDAIRQSCGNADELRHTSLKIMAQHTSSRERLPFLDEFYRVLLADLPPVKSVLDLACGLNPLSIPWMSLPDHVTYYACDIYQDQIDFLNGYFRCTDVQGRAEVCDLIFGCPPGPADLVLLLKTIPCLEQVHRSAGRRLLDTIEARHILISYPVRSLGGRGGKGMISNYGEHFDSLVRGKPWKVERFEFATELVFRLEK